MPSCSDATASIPCLHASVSAQALLWLTWSLALSIIETTHATGWTSEKAGLVGVDTALVLTTALAACTSQRHLRARLHNTWERIHRSVHPPVAPLIC